MVNRLRQFNHEERKPLSLIPRLRGDGLGGEAVAFDLQALQVFRQPHLESQDFQVQVGVFQEPLSLLRGLGSVSRSP